AEIGSVAVTLGDDQADHVRRGIVHRWHTREIDEEFERVTLDAAEAFGRGQSDHVCTQYNSRPCKRPLSYADPPTPRLSERVCNGRIAHPEGPDSVASSRVARLAAERAEDPGVSAAARIPHRSRRALRLRRHRRGEIGGDRRSRRDRLPRHRTWPDHQDRSSFERRDEELSV